MPLLHLWQEHFGFITDETATWIAEKLGVQPINILELITFYPMFRQQPLGNTHFRVCRTLSCAMAGSYELMDKLRQITGVDGSYSIEFVECLASCGTAPVCMVNDELHENVRPDFAANILGGQPPLRYVNLPHSLEHRTLETGCRIG